MRDVFLDGADLLRQFHILFRQFPQFGKKEIRTGVVEY